MGEPLPWEAFASILDDPLPAAQRRRVCQVRQAFYTLVQREAEQRPLSRRARRRFVRYGVRLGLDAFETRLLVAGAEFRAGRSVPPNPVARGARPDAPLAPPRAAWAWLLLNLALASALGIAGLILTAN